MASEYRSYLAANILNEDRVDAFRVPPAAECPLSGQDLKSEEDGQMKSSPLRSSPVQCTQEFMEDTPVLSVSLVREEELESVRALYETISSIHVYSLGPHPLKDLQVLSDATREVGEKYYGQDPLEAAKIYGTIINKWARRRKGRRPVPQSQSLAMPVKAKILIGEDSKVLTSSNSSSGKADSKASQSSVSKDFLGKSTSKKETAGGASDSNSATKREPSSIFKAFAKAKPKLQRQGTDSSAAASGVESAAPSGSNDEPMKDESDDEEDEYVVPEPSAKQLVDRDRNSRKEREDALKKMMEDDDKEVLASPTEIEESEPETALSKELISDDPAEVVEVSKGRQRGRRRIMKKKTIKDEEGYLVTREEPAWESFSEDEPIVLKTIAASSSFNSSASRAAKSTGKSGQGSIMSFFGKPKQ